ncbi:MAG: alpha-glucosidase [Clostridia bacterium]|nr:alpha-glucosidase [Clostridia bacterium]
MKENREEFFNWIVYQIYPRSFYDTNGDGIGDLNGIKEKIPHLKSLGVNAVWLCPCYKSPNNDNGYDVSDYRDIMEDFGTFSDWKRLQKALKKDGIKLIMDLVLNHTSSQHKWFQEAKTSQSSPYHEYYIWRKNPPNDWKSVFGGSAWAYNESTDEYYLHSFDETQPDLNWENPKVRQEAAKIVDFWVKLGVDGFRCDVLDFISKDFKKDKMFQGPRLHEYIRELFDRDGVRDIFTVGECQADKKTTLLLCGKNRGELKTAFQFDHIHLGRIDKYLPRPFSFDEIKSVLVKWQKFSQKHDLIYPLFTDNHDQPYYISRLGNDKAHRYACATAYATTFYLLRGVPFLYQGQEYGAANPYYTKIEDFRDVETKRYYAEQKKSKPRPQLMQEINYASRDNSRRPFAWTKDERTNFGFSAATPWIPCNSRAKEINLEKDLESERSVFRYFQTLLAFRKGSLAIRQGSFQDRTKRRRRCFLYERKWKQERLLIVCNFDKKQKIKLPKNRKFLFGNYPEAKEEFLPFQAAVYEL